MSYLSQSLRLHFAGQFQATVSTVNNDVTHFNNDTFQKSFHDQAAGAVGGWWNPNGDGVWRLLGCAITAAFMADGSAAAGSDPVLGYSLADSDDSAPAKIVDLDPQQQMVSTIFGLTVRIADANGNTLMKGAFEPAAFTELWSKVWSSAAGGDAAFGAMWQSVVQVKEWGNISASPFLKALKASADANGGLLSIKFNVDLYSMHFPAPNTAGGENFCRGRIVGTLGPASVSEPRRFVPGRQLAPVMVGGGAVVNFCAAVVDAKRKLVRLDLGNALPVKADGSFFPLGDLLLKVPNPNTGGTVVIGTLMETTYTDANWYRQTAGVVEFPTSKPVQDLVPSNPLLLAIGGSRSSPVMAQEMQDGYHVRADLFVFRLSAGKSATATFYATQFGSPLPKAKIALFDNPGGLQGPTAPAGTRPGSLTDGQPYVDAPATGISFPTQITTDAQGLAQLKITGGDTQTFRSYIDGQIYGIGYGLNVQGYAPVTGPVQSLNNTDAILANPWNFISVLVFDKFTPDSPPTWWGSMQPIFQQYANLYPVMARFIDLGNYEQVKSYARMLIHAFSLPDEDPNAMPVTRDLSPAKRAAILTWLKNPLPGTPPRTGKPKALAAAASLPKATPKNPGGNLHGGGKSAAMDRRVSARRS